MALLNKTDYKIILQLIQNHIEVNMDNEEEVNKILPLEKKILNKLYK